MKDEEGYIEDDPAEVAALAEQFARSCRASLAETPSSEPKITFSLPEIDALSRPPLPKKKPKQTNDWLIWSNEHDAWWGPNSMGYRLNRGEAGRYSFDEARTIVLSANRGLTQRPHEAMVEDI